MARYLVIRAPDDGAILRRYVDPGALIRAGQNDGTALLKFARIDRVRVVVDVPMADTRTARSSAVTSGLSGGEQVILAGGSQITAGQPVDAVLAQK